MDFMQSEDMSNSIDRLAEEITQLRDLFVRRLSEDKTKARLCENLTEQNTFLNRILEERVLESLFRELLLVCDRIETNEETSDFLKSIEEEILEVFARREIDKIEDFTAFNPQYHKAVGTILSDDRYVAGSIVSVVKNGYIIRNRLLRPAEVVVAVDQQ